MITDCTSPVGHLEEFLALAAPELAPVAVLNRLVGAGLGALPLPGGGETELRWSLLRALGRHDLSLARLAEGHADALAVLAEAGRVAPAGAVLGVWAAGPLGELKASPDDDGWRLQGRRRWCSGAPSLTHALVRAEAEDGDRVFLVSLDDPGVRPISGSWPAVGMADSLTLDVDFVAVHVDARDAIGDAGFYLSRRGFWLGAIGVAAVWLGGAEGVARVLAVRAGEDPHRLAHLGAVSARLFSLDTLMARAAAGIDEDGLSGPALEHLARIVRAEVEAGASEVLERTGRATGAEPLGHDAAHARRVADLTVYLRQSHGEADLALLGRLGPSRLGEGVAPR